MYEFNHDRINADRDYLLKLVSDQCFSQTHTEFMGSTVENIKVDLRPIVYEPNDLSLLGFLINAILHKEASKSRLIMPRFSIGAPIVSNAALICAAATSPTISPYGNKMFLVDKDQNYEKSGLLPTGDIVRRNPAVLLVEHSELISLSLTQLQNNKVDLIYVLYIIQPSSPHYLDGFKDSLKEAKYSADYVKPIALFNEYDILSYRCMGTNARA